MDQNEANNTTGEKKDEVTNMASLLEEQGLGLELPQSGEIKTGVIASISAGQIMVGIGAKSEGIISGQEFEYIPPEVFASMEVGQEIPVYVITPEDQNGNLILSYVRALEAESWTVAERVMAEKETFTGKVVGYNRGGLLVSFDKLQGFVPSSQLSFSRRADLSGESPEKRFGEMIGEEMVLNIIEVDQERRRLIFSEKSAVHESRDSIRDKVIEKLNVGDVRTGRVTSLADFGAFVNINGADGLVHLSEISWDRIRHPGDELEVGQEVNVEIISIDEEKRRIGLSIRRLKDDPWQKQIEGLRVGQLVEAKITRLTKFGAFAMLENNMEGLIHISEISDEHIGHPKEVLHEDDDVTLRIIKIEADSHRIGLSLRRVDSLAYADMDMKVLEKELDQTGIHVVGEEKTGEAEAGQEDADKASVDSDAVPEQVEEPVAEEMEVDGKEDADKASVDTDAVAEQVEEPTTEELETDGKEEANKASVDSDAVSEQVEEPAAEELEADGKEDAESTAVENPDAGNEDESTAADAA